MLTGIATVLLPVSRVPAQVQSTITERAHPVYGASAGELVRNLRASPVAGDHGDALATIRPTYALSVSPVPVANGCRAAAVIQVDFTLTLPQAADETRLDRGSLASWRAFVAFTRRHEMTHRDIYLACAREAVATIRASRFSTCDGLHGEAQRILSAANQRCAARHAAFDRRDLPNLWRLPAIRRADGAAIPVWPRRP